MKPQKFIAVFTRGRKCALSSAIWSQCTLISLRSILVLFSKLRLGDPSCRLPSCCQAKNCRRFSSLPYVSHVTPISPTLILSHK